MSVVQSMKQTENKTTEVQMSLYRWNGKSFQILQTFRNYGTRKVTPFSIGDTNYLAVANSRGEDGKSLSYLINKVYQRI